MSEELRNCGLNGISTSNQRAWVLDDINAEDVARGIIDGKQKEPFYIFDMDEAFRRIQHFKEMMPRVKPFYAMKANDWELMLKLVISQGLGFDCASVGEICKVLKSVIFAMPCKTPEQMKYAREAGVKHTTFDSSYELKKMAQHWPDVNLLLRIRVDGESIYVLGEKFGCDFETEAIGLLEEAASLGLSVVGVAFHVGSACSSTDSHSLGLQRARALFDHEARAGRQMRIVDIGGGFMGSNTNDIDQVSKMINKALEEYFPEPSVQVIAEPGRYLCESSTTLYTSICNIRRITKNNTPVNMFYINDGLHGTLRYTEPWHTVEKFQRNGIEIYDSNYTEEAILWGPTCDSVDRIMEHRSIRLPMCTPFDWLVFRNQGAYTWSYQGTFSCMELPKMRAIVSTVLWNRLKDHPVFSPVDFILNADVFSPLPSSIPHIPKQLNISNSFTNYTLLSN